MAEQERIIHPEGSPWFWKIFGGAIMGIISILLLGHITNINSTMDRTFLDLRGDIKEIRQHQELQRERMLAAEQNTHKIMAMEKMLATLQTSLDEHKQKVAACDANNSSLKEEIKTLREWNKDLSKQIQEFRERLAAEKAKKPEGP